jgi:curved DNA-binding protein CbpA
MTNEANLKAPAASSPSLSIAEIDERITFHKNSEIMEVSFAGMRLSNSLEVNHFYDRIEERIAGTGEELWFFLVNYCDTRIDNEAWFAFSRRGMDLNKAHSMGSVRFDASEITRRQIERDAGTEAFDPNMFYDRDGALKRLQSLLSKRRKKLVLVPNFDPKEWNWRIEFNPDEQIMNVDFTNFSFEHSRDVNDVYDFIESQIKPLGTKWYFLINYEGTRIQSPAWIEYAARGKKLNQEFSLGSVRYAPGSETETDIRLRAESQGFRPNIRNTREEAMELIAEMKAANAGSETSPKL